MSPFPANMIRAINNAAIMDQPATAAGPDYDGEYRPRPGARAIGRL